MKTLAIIAAVLCSGCVMVRVTNVGVKVDKDFDIRPVVRDLVVSATCAPLDGGAEAGESRSGGAR